MPPATLPAATLPPAASFRMPRATLRPAAFSTRDVATLAVSGVATGAHDRSDAIRSFTSKAARADARREPGQRQSAGGTARRELVPLLRARWRSDGQSLSGDLQPSPSSASWRCARPDRSCGDEKRQGAHALERAPLSSAPPCFLFTRRPAAAHGGAAPAGTQRTGRGCTCRPVRQATGHPGAAPSASSPCRRSGQSCRPWSRDR